MSYYWCKQSAEQGYAPAEYRLGIMEKDGYNEGHNGGKWAEHDFVSALKWFMRAARHGNANAKNEYDKLKQFAFGNADRLLIQAVNCLLQNDNAKCVSLFKEASGSVIREKDSWGSEKYSEMLSDFLPDLMARTIDALTFKAEADVALAQSILGRIYVQADGFERICNEDFPKGYDWLVRAKANGDEFATEYLRTSPKVKKYEAGQKIARELDEDDIASLLKAGRAFQKGEGVKSDKAKAMSYYKKATALGSREAKYLLGDCEDDKENAVALFRDAAMKWFPTTICDKDGWIGAYDGPYDHYGESCRNVAEDFEWNHDAKNAAKWFRFAARSGSYRAAGKLGYDYWKGESGFEVDLEKAVYWLQIATWLYFFHVSSWGNEYENYLKEAEECLEQQDGDRDLIAELLMLEDEDVFVAGCKGDPESQYEIGCWMYDGDQGFSKDVCAAMAWWYRAAMQGYVKAQLRIADMLYKGCDDVEKDEEEAFKWYSKAAEQNDPAAQNKLGFFYLNGRGGVEKDYSEAFRYFKMSAENGDAIGQRELGNAFGLGRGVEKNYGEAFKWFLKSAEKGDANAQINIGDFYKTGKGVDVDYTKALMWYEKALDKCGAKAKLKIGQLYLDGKGVEKDEAKAFSLLKESAEDGDGMAMAFCGLLCRDGRGTVSNKEKAFEWFRKSAEKGVLNGKLCLARAYRNGDGVVQQLGKAKELFEELAEKGNPRGCYYLGDMLEKGEGGEVDIEKAKAWYEKAAAAGDKDAKAALERLG